MARRSLLPLTLTVLLAGMGAWIYFYEIKGEADRAEDKDADKKVFSIDRAAVTEIEITNRHGQFRFQKDDGGWKIVAPVQVPADLQGVDDILTSVGSARSVRVLKDAGGRLDAFDLTEPDLAVTVTAGATRERLAIGADAPFGGQYYARRDESTEVLILDDAIRAQLDKDLQGFRNRSVVTLEASQVARVSVEGPGLAGFAAVRRDNRWYADSAGVSFRLKKRAVDDLLFDLKGLEAVDFVDDPSTVTAALTPPAVTVTLKPTTETSADATPVVVHFGQVLDDGRGLRPAQVAGRSEVLLVKGDATGPLEVTIDGLRDRAPVAFDRWQVDKIEVKLGGKSYTASRQDFEWTVTPEDGPWKVEKITALLDLLMAGEAETFGERQADLAPFGLASPALELALTVSEQNQTVKVALGRDPAGAVWVATDGDGTLYRMPPAFLEDLIATIDPPAAQPPPLPPMDPPSAGTPAAAP